MSKEFKAINPEQVHDNAMNNSTSKMLYSFPKDKRFPKQTPLNAPYYNLPDIKSQRATSLGFGKKTEFEDIRGYPPPNKYELKGQFEKKNTTGPSFGISREQAKASSASMFKVISVPGPGAYNPKYKYHLRSASLCSRTKDHSLDEKIKVPGPGQYDTNHSTLYGKITNSKYESIRCPVIPKNSCESNKTDDTKKTPAPWTYEPIVMTRKGGRWLRDGKAYKFNRSKRIGFETKSKTPGPGQYSCFSEFSK